MLKASFRLSVIVISAFALAACPDSKPPPGTDRISRPLPQEIQAQYSPGEGINCPLVDPTSEPMWPNFGFRRGTTPGVKEVWGCKMNLVEYQGQNYFVQNYKGLLLPDPVNPEKCKKAVSGCKVVSGSRICTQRDDLIGKRGPCRSLSGFGPNKCESCETAETTLQ